MPMPFSVCRPRRPLFPKAKKKVVEEFEGEENDIIASDPRVAALERAKKREAEKQEDDELLDDIEGAEEDFEVVFSFTKCA